MTNAPPALRGRRRPSLAAGARPRLVGACRLIEREDEGAGEPPGEIPPATIRGRTLPLEPWAARPPGPTASLTEKERRSLGHAVPPVPARESSRAQVLRRVRGPAPPDLPDVQRREPSGEQ